MVSLNLVMLHTAYHTVNWIIVSFPFHESFFLEFCGKTWLSFLFASTWRMWAMSAMLLDLGVLDSATRTTFLPSGHCCFQNAFPHKNKPFKKAILLSDSVSARRGFKTHYGPWSTGGDHQTHITAADLRAPYTTLGYDFHDQVLFQLRLSI